MTKQRYGGWSSHRHNGSKWSSTMNHDDGSVVSFDLQPAPPDDEPVTKPLSVN